MNYYPFHIGDYVSATRHLSWEEDAAFRRLLDTYYTTEKPIPADLRAACRLVMAQTDSQREAVRVVLDEFFTPTDAGWINKRADAEIDAMREKQQKQRDKANKRWAMPKAEHGNATASQTDATASKGDADAMPPTPTPTPTPTPIPIPIQEDPPATRVPPAVAGHAPKARASKRCPDSFAPGEEMQQWAREEAPRADFSRELAKFRDYTFKTAHSDWPAAFRNWLRKASDDARTRPQSFQDRKAAEAGKWMNPPGARAELDYIDMEATDAAPLALR